ncbi:sugar kinase [Microbacterium sp. KUDC0406]|uniref:sugar kinase n=1 Tax=Microbacterium sp. KUDC0406 TaxID=2909588 RepID=UPI001F22F5A0|nr:sugar kinase [Microbacterium sp. KUDC0406]UJP10492.1 sugar kinase [Microbacterium sp. KUDC0406]
MRPHTGTAPDVICLGEPLALFTAADGPLATSPTATIGLGGAEFNVAAGLVAAGHRAAYATRLGSDPLGARIAADLRLRGVEPWIGWDEDAPTGLMIKDPGVDGSHVLYYRAGSAASRMAPGFLAPDRFIGTRIVHTSGIPLAISASARALVDEVFGLARAAGALVSFDVNDRRALWPLEEAGPVLRRFADAADIVFVGRDEAERVWGTPTADDIRALLPRTALLVVKDGDIGATAYSAEEAPVFVPAPSVDVVEPVGAGDAFAAGFLGATLEDLPLAERLARGHASAGRVLRIAGDLPPV